MLPSQDAIILSIATSVRLYAMCIPLLKHPPPYLAGLGANFGVIREHLVARGVFNRLGGLPRPVTRLFPRTFQAAIARVRGLTTYSFNTVSLASTSTRDTSYVHRSARCCRTRLALVSLSWAPFTTTWRSIRRRSPARSTSTTS